MWTGLGDNTELFWAVLSQASAVKSRLGPNRDTWNTIEAQRRTQSVDNNRNNRSRHHDDRGCGRRHDNDDDRDCSWSLNQRGPRAFG
jgi:hypothetical protein